MSILQLALYTAAIIAVVCFVVYLTSLASNPAPSCDPGFVPVITGNNGAWACVVGTRK